MTSATVWTGVLRRRPVRIVEGRARGGSPTRSRSSAATAATIPTGITATSRLGFGRPPAVAQPAGEGDGPR